MAPERMLLSATTRMGIVSPLNRADTFHMVIGRLALAERSTYHAFRTLRNMERTRQSSSKIMPENETYIPIRAVLTTYGWVRLRLITFNLAKIIVVYDKDGMSSFCDKMVHLRYKVGVVELGLYAAVYNL
jgi:hypothetical protein